MLKKPRGHGRCLFAVKIYTEEKPPQKRGVADI